MRAVGSRTAVDDLYRVAAQNTSSATTIYRPLHPADNCQLQQRKSVPCHFCQLPAHGGPYRLVSSRALRLAIPARRLGEYSPAFYKRPPFWIFLGKKVRQAPAYKATRRIQQLGKQIVQRRP